MNTTSGNFYARLRDTRKDDNALAACIDSVVKQLEEESTSSDRPGMLLGKIQSGKTRAFVGVIARAFDRGFDIAIVLTKGTKTLSAQTVSRLTSDFKEFIDEDEFVIFDIMQPPGRLTKSEQRRKLVIVAKKQSENLRRLHQFLETDYPDLKNRKVLLIDDEADLASIRFVRPKDNPDIEQGKIAEQMDNLRRIVSKVAFLQVTATPYSLYLQPEDYEPSDDGYVFKPKKPAFTELLPIHSGYVGGNDYFIAANDDDPRSFLIVEVTRDEQDSLRRPDQRRIKEDNVLENQNTQGLVRAVVTFILAVCIRRWQQAEAGEKKRKYAMIIHNDTQKAAHAWQDQVIDWVFKGVEEAAAKSPKTLEPLFNSAFNDLSASIAADRGRLPVLKDAFAMFIEALQSEDVVRETVNSDKDVMALLDEKAELRLRTPFNIFVGGNILDRGITIPNLLAFYYGRNPKTMQADTVLQHSRMYGNRDRRDLAVTRFYTSRDVYDRLFTINTFENALREAFENGAHERGVVFIQADARRRVRPCAPNKVLLSNVIAVRPNGLYLPTGFQTVSATDLKKPQKEIDSLIPPGVIDTQKFVEISKEDALEILKLTEKSLEFTSSDFDWDAMRGLLDYYSDIRDGGDRKVLLLAESGRDLHRERSGDKSGLSIIGSSGGSGELRRLILDPSRSRPALILLQQKGDKDRGWKGHSFWWPILAAPGTVEPCVFATKVAAD
jgi:hypothetical protein